MPLPATCAPDVDSVTFAEPPGEVGEVEPAAAADEATGRGGGWRPGSWAGSPGAANVAWAGGAGKAVAGVPDSAALPVGIAVAEVEAAALLVGVAAAGVAAAALPVAWAVPGCCAVTPLGGVAVGAPVEGGIGPSALVG